MDKSFNEMGLFSCFSKILEHDRFCFLIFFFVDMSLLFHELLRQCELLVLSQFFFFCVVYGNLGSSFKTFLCILLIVSFF